MVTPIQPGILLSRIGSKMINARSESVAEKPSFRNAFKKRRCLILADGFYEWTGEKGHKQPVFITLPDKNPFAFAGLWESWNNKGAEKDPYKFFHTIFWLGQLALNEELENKSKELIQEATELMKIFGAILEKSK